MSAPDDVLAEAAPQFAADDLARLVAAHYGVHGQVGARLDSERDQVVLFGGVGRELVVKVSNAAESPTNIALEEAAALWAAAADPGLPLATPLPVADTGARHLVARHPDTGAAHVVRAYDRLPGATGLDPAELGPAAVGAWGAASARTGRALRGFFHPAAQRRLLWHAEQRAETAALTGHIDDPAVRGLVESAFAGFEDRVGPRWNTLRAQVLHTDLTLDNVLFDADEVSGLLDFGDLTHTTLVFDIAAAFGSLAGTLDGAPLFRALRLFLDGYRGVVPLEPEELEVLGDTVALRAAITLCISHWRAADHADNLDYIRGWDAIAINLLRQFDALGPDEVTARLGGPVPAPRTAPLARRRAAVFGTALAPLAYTEPLHLVRGRAATLVDSNGREYIDAYNNVPVVGHAHPRVSAAIADQARLLSTNLRYLHPRAIELAERLTATAPAGLDTVLFVNSGSEATDLAWRLATATTGRAGALVTDFAYHGVTTASTALSPEEWRAGWRPRDVERFAAPTGDHPDTAAFEAAVERLRGGGADPAMLIVDTAYTSDGILAPGPDYHRALGDAARAAGAIVVADEVQAGFGRAGDHLWSFEGAGLHPDVIALGKPMGNGYPLAAVITRAALVEALGAEAEFFSTFAGSPVAAAAGLAVLDVIADEGLVARAAARGAQLRRLLGDALAGNPAVAAVRGRGLLVGVDLSAAPAGTVERVLDRARAEGVLIGSTGPRYDVLKIRPPLVVSEREVERVAEVVAEAVTSIADC